MELRKRKEEGVREREEGERRKKKEGKEEGVREREEGESKRRRREGWSEQSQQV